MGHTESIPHYIEALPARSVSNPLRKHGEKDQASGLDTERETFDFSLTVQCEIDNL